MLVDSKKMVDAEETKRKKAREMRYKKPITKNLNLDYIQQELWDIQEECENVHYFFDTDEETLINALDGNEDEAYEFRTMFADLCGECERMQDDLNEEWIPDCFDRFFVAIGAGETFGGYLGWDEYEQDYFGLSCTDAFAETESRKALKQLTKDNLIDSACQCLRVYQSYIALRYRYDCLKATMDILRDQNTGYLQAVKEIEKLYEAASEDEWTRQEYSKESREWKRYTDALPPEAWIQ